MSTGNFISIVGAAVGGYFGGPTGAQWGFAIGSAIGGQVDIANTQIHGYRQGDLKVPSLEYGSSILRLWGRVRHAAGPIWMSRKREISSTDGGKGAEPETTSYTYEVDVLYLLCDNPIDAVARVWANGELIYSLLDGSDDATRAASAASDKWTDIRVYTGAADQLPDPVYEAAVGIGNAPAYRHRGTLMIEGLQLGNSGQLPVLTFEILTEATLGPPVCMELDPQPPHYWAEGQLATDESQVVVATGGNISISATFDGFSTGGYLRTAETVSGCRRYFEIEINDTSTAFAEVFYVWVCDGSGNRFRVIRQEDQHTNNNVISIVIDADQGVAWRRTDFDDAWGTPTPVTTTPPFDPVLGVNGKPTGLTGQDLYIEIEFPTPTGYIFHTSVLRTTAAEFTEEMPDMCIPWTSTGVDAGSVTPGTVYLDEVVSDLCVQSGLTVDDIDVTELADTEVVGVPVTQVSPARSTLEVLSQAYNFGCVESDKLYFRMRGRAIAETFAFEDIGAGENEAKNEDPVGLVRGSDIELPARFAVQYLNVDDDYKSGTVYTDRLISQSAETRPVSVPLVLPADRAQGMANTLAMDMRVAATSIKPSILATTPELEPTDVIGVTDDDGTVYRARINRETFSGQVRSFECVLDDQSAITELGTAQEYTPSITVRKAALSVMEVLDIPILRDADDGPGPYVAVKAAGDKWPGATVYSSPDDSTYAAEGALTRQAVIGETTTALDDWEGSTVFDEFSSVTVDVGAGTLASVTRDDLLNTGVNLALIGDELIQFRSAALQGTGVYELTGLLRGRRGTEWAMTGHASGDRFVLLKDSGLLHVATDASWIEQLTYWKAVTATRTLQSTRAEEFTDTGRAIKPFAPVDLRASRSRLGDITLTWKRRTRLSTRLGGAVGIVVPLGEASENYVVEIYEDDSFTTIARALESTTAAVTYTVEQQGSDFGSVQSELSVKVYQVGALGGGYPLVETISTDPGYSAFQADTLNPRPVILLSAGDDFLATRNGLVSSVGFYGYSGGDTMLSLVGQATASDSQQYLAGLAISATDSATGNFVLLMRAQDNPEGLRKLMRGTLPGGPVLVSPSFMPANPPVSIWWTGSEFRALLADSHVWSSATGDSWTDEGEATGGPTLLAASSVLAATVVKVGSALALIYPYLHQVLYCADTDGLVWTAATGDLAVIPTATYSDYFLLSNMASNGTRAVIVAFGRKPADGSTWAIVYSSTDGEDWDIEQENNSYSYRAGLITFGGDFVCGLWPALPGTDNTGSGELIDFGDGSKLLWSHRAVSNGQGGDTYALVIGDGTTGFASNAPYSTTDLLAYTSLTWDE